jgi:hypothetical protein
MGQSNLAALSVINDRIVQNERLSLFMFWNRTLSGGEQEEYLFLDQYQAEQAAVDWLRDKRDEENYEGIPDDPTYKDFAMFIAESEEWSGGVLEIPVDLTLL